MYYELIENDIQNRGRVVHGSSISLVPFHAERYLSMFGFDKSIYEHIEIKKTEIDENGKLKYPNGTVSGFGGFYFCNTVYLDIDIEDAQQESLDCAKRVVHLFYEKLNVNPKHLTIAFSGNKGFHIGINKNLFGGIEPDKELPKTIQILVGSIVAELFDTSLIAIDQHLKEQKVKNYHGIDLGIYNANRIFRVLNSKHVKSGLYKIGLTSKELFTMALEDILTMAKQPRPDYKPEYITSELKPNENLVRLFADAKKFDSEAYNKEFNKSKGGTSQGNFFSPPIPGNRNSSLFAQACILFDHSQFNEESVRQLVACINLASEKPLADDEVRNIVKSASKRTSKNQKKETVTNPTITNDLETFNVWFDEWVDYYTKEQSGLTCLFREIDEDNEFNYEGKLACLIGKGGSRKSYGALNIIANNIQSYNARVAYSSMEMGKVELVNRILDIVCEPQEKLSPSVTLKQLVRQDKEGIRLAMKDTMAHIDSHLVLSNQSFMTAEDYEKWVQRTIEIHGDIKILVVDGLSAMGGKGTETEVYSRNTLALKEIAKKYNLFVILICHVTKEAKAYERDPKDKVRGSEKILDNADFFISFSQLIDEFTSTPDNLKYSRSCGFAKYYNKRGTGLTLDKVFFMDSLTKKIEETNRPADDFPTYEKFIADFSAKQKKNSKDKF